MTGSAPGQASGVVEHLHVFAAQGGEPRSLEDAWFVVGRGVPGDRRDRAGHRRPVTAIRSESMDSLAALLGTTFVPGSSRRNLMIRGLDLDHLPRGTTLSIGEAAFVVLGPCDPCQKLEGRLGPGTLTHLKHRGGVVLAVSAPGRVRRGDRVSVLALGDRPLHARRG